MRWGQAGSITGMLCDGGFSRSHAPRGNAYLGHLNYEADQIYCNWITQFIEKRSHYEQSRLQDIKSSGSQFILWLASDRFDGERRLPWAFNVFKDQCPALINGCNLLNKESHNIYCAFSAFLTLKIQGWMNQTLLRYFRVLLFMDDDLAKVK